MPVDKTTTRKPAAAKTSATGKSAPAPSPDAAKKAPRSRSTAKSATAAAPAAPVAKKAAARAPAATARKPAASATAAPRARAAMVAAKPAAPTVEERRRWIAIAAYHRAEQRGFVPGYELQDWLEAEGEIDALFGSA